METVLIILSVLVLLAVSGVVLFFFVGPVLAGRFKSDADRKFEVRHTHRRKLAK